MVLDSYVDANKEFTLKIPLHVKCSAKYTIDTDEKEHLAEFYIQGPRGNPFGHKITLKIKVLEKIDESEFYQRAMNIYEKIGGDFEKIVEILGKADNNQSAAEKMLKND